MPLLLVLSIYCILIVFSSIFGGSIPSLVRMTHVRMQLILSLVGGFMLGVALLHLLPHGYAACGDLDLVMGCTLLGLIFTFLMIRTLHFHQHGPVTHDADDHDHESCDHHSHSHAVSWIGVAFGLGVHTVMDGVAVGAAVFADAGHHHGIAPGFAVFLAVLLHKPLDALSIISVMSSGGISEKKRWAINIVVALMCPMGVLLVAVLVGFFGEAGPLSGRWLGVLQGLAAGAFLCISLSDLLPEVQFHSHDRGRLSLALLLGVAFAYGIGYLEGEHSHSHPGMQVPAAVEQGDGIRASHGSDVHGHESHDH